MAEVIITGYSKPTSEGVTLHFNKPARQKNGTGHFDKLWVSWDKIGAAIIDGYTKEDGVAERNKMRGVADAANKSSNKPVNSITGHYLELIMEANSPSDAACLLVEYANRVNTDRPVNYTREDDQPSMNWQQLKDYCNSLDEEQLKHNVMLWREDECINSIYAEALDEDMYLHEDDEDGCYPLSEAQHPIDQLQKVYTKGFPLLYENF